MPKIFLCYRRRDTAGVAGRLFDRLKAHFGDDSVVMDVDTMPFGVDFREYLNTEVAQCDVLLAVMGPRWLVKTAKGRKIDDPKDFVRIEIEAALQRQIPVIPVRINRVRMPAEADLPPSIAPLAYRNAVEVDEGRDFHVNIDRLIRGIEFHLKTKSSPSPDPSPEPQPTPTPSDERWTNSLGMTFVRIKPGSFLMGSTRKQIDHLMRLFPDSKREWFDYEQPRHLVAITRPYLLGVHPVTQGQYQAIIGKHENHFKGPDDLPAESVSWFGAVAFCNKLSEPEGRKPFYHIAGDEVTVVGGNGYRLPTEAEWEYACRAESEGLFPFGDNRQKLGEHAWYDKNSEAKTHPVGQKSPNAWGLCDMLGNVWEWCADWYDAKYYASSPAADPPGAAGASYRVFRGGSWDRNARFCRPAYRSRGTPDCWRDDLGFRVAAVQE
jgi:formylglycine-generating enzyme required for sulfatase activity